MSLNTMSFTTEGQRHELRIEDGTLKIDTWSVVVIDGEYKDIEVVDGFALDIGPSALCLMATWMSLALNQTDPRKAQIFPAVHI